MTYMLMNHRPVPDNALIQYKVTVETDPLTPVQPYWLDVNDCRADPIYNVPGIKGKGSTANATRDYMIPSAGRIVAGAGHVHGGARNLASHQDRLRQLAARRVEPDLGPRRPSLLQRAPDPARAGADQHERVPDSDGHPGGGRRENPPQLELRQLAAARPGDGDLPRLHRARPCGHPGLRADRPGTSRPTRPTSPGGSGPIPFKIPLTGLDASGNAVTIKKPGGKLKRAKPGTTTQVRDRFFGRRNLKVKRGDIAQLAVLGGRAAQPDPRQRARRDRHRQPRPGPRLHEAVRAPGTYRFFCALHPVQMTQRVVVEGKKKKKGKKKRR